MKISNAVLTILDNSNIYGQAFRLPTGQLDRTMYMAVNKVIELAGGKWSRKEKAHMFQDDPVEIMDQIILTGEVLDKKKELGYFPTPRPVAERLIELAEIEFEHTVLEPSCGQGAIVWELVRETPNIQCYEIDPKNAAEMLRHLDVPVTVTDFLTVKPIPIYDRVVMNPPFARQQDLKHVNHALKFLKPGGRLVSVMAAGIMFRQNFLAEEFRAMVASRKGFFEDNPVGSFKESGTEINTVNVVINGA